MNRTTTDLVARTEFIAGFRALAEFLEAHPGLPVPRFSFNDGLTIYLSGDGVGERAEVDRVAGVLETTPDPDSSGLYQAARRFGGPVTYRIVAVPPSDSEPAGARGEA
jgi:hypothetical protein